MQARFKTTCVALALLTSVSVVQSPLAQQNAPVIAVGDIQSSYANWDTISVQTALESALSKTRKFIIMERGRLDELLKERGLSMSGIADGNASLGGFSGVDYLLYGRVMQASLDSQNVILMTQCKGTVSLDVRTVDVNTGEIRFSESVQVSEVVATAGGDDNPCRGVTTSTLAPLSALAAEAVAEKLTVALFPVKLVRVATDQAYLNYGSPFLAPGNYMKVITLGEGFVDPDTGEVLGADEEELGYLIVREVRPKFSIADIVYRYENPMAVGDVAMKLSSSEAKSVGKMLAGIEKAKARQERDCRNAQKRVQRNCSRNEESSKCLKARDDVSSMCL
ncbi:MAG: hypothetical protein F4171_17070 [Gammaproteobacteria bacterium]|nr:hypothetical protein [Gammaproteobacteria bacterium]MYH14837.1 hypothetical protein [Gammaproteobacteria bacterium]MYK29918.1 hypothetical protein [Gammaproteobacteria bacterium]MYK84388.1 hypothetical protein [Gammaproteobacteria bacterium]